MGLIEKFWEPNPEESFGKADAESEAVIYLMPEDIDRDSLEYLKLNAEKHQEDQAERFKFLTQRSFDVVRLHLSLILGYAALLRLAAKPDATLAESLGICTSLGLTVLVASTINLIPCMKPQRLYRRHNLTTLAEWSIDRTDLPMIASVRTHGQLAGNEAILRWVGERLRLSCILTIVGLVLLAIDFWI